ncbi:MAG: ATP-binding protein [Syntrophobacteraceae bacterium]
MAGSKILIVEDEGIEALDIQRRLINLGYPSPEVAYSGEEAIRMVEETCPDLVLMDIMLHGGIDGITAAEKIHDRYDIPVVYLTAYADDDTLRRAKITEPFGYLVKPFKERELHVTIDVALYKHKMEKKLRESEKWLATTLNSIGDAVVATDENCRITFMNPIAEVLMGWKLEETVNTELSKVFNIVNKETRQRVENPVERVLLEGATVGLANHTVLINRKGIEIPIDDSAAPIIDHKDNIIGVVLVFRDVTERENALAEICRCRDDLELRVRERTAELAEANEELVAYSKRLEVLNNELREFAFVASHDLREPLRKIQTFGNMLTRKYSGDLAAEGQDYVARMASAAKRMSDLLDSLLSYSRITSRPNPFQLINLTTIAQDVVNDMEFAIKKAGGRVEIGELPLIDADPVQIRQLLQNLISNSIKYRKDNEKPVIRIHGHTAESMCEVCVEDNGIGFDEQYADRIFRPFQRLHRRDENYEGTGIGLAICRKIVEHHGGSIRAESTPGEGATFIVQLPASKRRKE